MLALKMLIYTETLLKSEAVSCHHLDVVASYSNAYFSQVFEQ